MLAKGWRELKGKTNKSQGAPTNYSGRNLTSN